MGSRNRAFPREFREGARGGYGLGVVPCTPESSHFGAGVAAKCVELLPASTTSPDGFDNFSLSARVPGGGGGGYGLGVVPCTPESSHFGAGVAAKCVELLPASTTS